MKVQSAIHIGAFSQIIERKGAKEGIPSGARKRYVKRLACSIRGARDILIRNQRNCQDIMPCQI